MSNINLVTKLVGNISGDFIIPAYQRGYRWQEEVDMLLNDLQSIPDGDNYCLQPIVVKTLFDQKYELIDGQQRLTTIYLLLNYIKTFRPKLTIKYSIDYQIRDKSKQFLKNIDFDNIDDQASNIDEYFIKAAAKRIKMWFDNTGEDDNVANQIANKLYNKVKIIWYEIDSTEDSVSLFTRLNIGKIPLTNAELVRALFLTKNSGIDERYQLEITNQWDSIEKELHDDSLWAFATNKSADNYSTRIELLFDIMANKPENDRERLRTFFWFSEQQKLYPNAKIELWKRVIAVFQRIKEWYINRDLFHKIGYLIAVNEDSLQNLLQKSLNMPKDQFVLHLDQKIATSINFKEEYTELEYDKNYDQINRILILFNVESVRCNGDESMRFPFNKHKNKKGGWSLEHIHAQQSKGINTRELWNLWLDMHVSSLKALASPKNEELITEIETRDKETISLADCETLHDKVIAAFEFESNTDYIHSIENMALLGKFDNSALNNSTFDVKRNKIIEMDKNGEYIPYCTRMVFLKYYTPSKSNQIHFWGKDDRSSYIKAMNETLRPYLSLINKTISYGN